MVPRRSIRYRKPVDRFTPDAAPGYQNIKNYLNKIVNALNTTDSRIFSINYHVALSLNPTFGYLEGQWSPDFLNTHQGMFKAKSKHDPDTPTIRESLSGIHRDGFIEAMVEEVTELEKHGTWEVVNRLSIGSNIEFKVILTTWGFRIKRWPNGLM